MPDIAVVFLMIRGDRQTALSIHITEDLGRSAPNLGSYSLLSLQYGQTVCDCFLFKWKGVIDFR